MLVAIFSMLWWYLQNQVMPTWEAIINGFAMLVFSMLGQATQKHTRQHSMSRASHLATICSLTPLHGWCTRKFVCRFGR